MGNSIWIVLIVVTLVGCRSDSPPQPPLPASAGNVGAPGSTTDGGAGAAARGTDQWLGQWNGPEGTFLRLAGGNGKYEITIQNLDGALTYRGSAAADRVEFERNGVRESIRATDGVGTGMKWLRDKRTCLMIRVGEGYCRD